MNKERCSVQAAMDCLDRKDEAYREMLHLALTELHEAEAKYAALQARFDALRDELRRYTAAYFPPDVPRGA